MYTVIIVDDEPITRMDFKEMLQENGYKVVAQGADGFDAIELCKQYKPDVVLMDIKMPVFDGMSAADNILSEGLSGCVVLLTAYSDKEFIDKAKQIGITGYLVKPIEEHTLISTIEIALAQSKRYKNAVEESERMKMQIEEKSLIDRAKLIISKREGITEGDAYKLIQKMSMDKRSTMGSIGRIIVEGGSEREIIEKAKNKIMDINKVDEISAFNKIKVYSKHNDCSIKDAAEKIISMDKYDFFKKV